MKNISKYSIFYVVIFFSLILSACGPSSQNSGKVAIDEDGTKHISGNITISGAWALYPLANIWAEEFIKIHPEVRINISAGGAGKGFADALSQAVDLGMFSREIKDEEKAQGVWWVSVTKDAVLPTINVNNPVLQQIKTRGLTQEEFRKIFITREITNWGEVTNGATSEKIGLYTRSDAAGAAATWAEYLGAKGQEELQGIGVYGDPGLADAVKKDKNSIGYNNVIYAYDLQSGNKYSGIEVIPIDVNGDGKISDNENFYDDLKGVIKAIGDGRYPSPPARELYFISKGKPTNQAAVEFLKWILTEGQQFIDEAGYIRLPKETINRELAKLDVAM